MKSVSDRQQLSLIARKMFPGKQAQFLSIYDQCMSDCLAHNENPYGCLFSQKLDYNFISNMCVRFFSDLVLDLDILSDNNHRLRTGILSGEIPFIYQMS